MFKFISAQACYFKTDHPDPYAKLCNYIALPICTVLVILLSILVMAKWSPFSVRILQNFCCHLLSSPFMFSELDIMMRNVDYLLVLYHDRKKRSQKGCMTSQPRNFQLWKIFQPQNFQRWNIQPWFFFNPKILNPGISTTNFWSPDFSTMNISNLWVEEL